MSRKTRAAIYCRVSTDEQADRGTSLSDQAARCELYCVEQGWTVVDRFVDEGVSGATTERPALSLLMVGARASAFNMVVVTDPDRLSRDLVDGLIIERELAQAGIEVVYLIQPTMGTLERQLRGVIAEEERRKIRDRTSRGLRAVAAAGYWPGGPPPYGYRIDADPQGHSSLEIDADEAKVLVWMISALVDDRRTTWEVAADLNAKGVPTASESRKTANRGTPRWTHRRVRQLLSDAQGIAGTWHYKTSAGTFTLQIPPIVTEQRLEQLRIRLAETSTGKNATRKRYTYLLAGRITSPCGHNMHAMAKPGGTNRVYRCSMNPISVGPTRCDCRRVSADAIETAVWNLIAAELTDPARLEKLAGLAADETPPTDIADIATLDRKVRRVEGALGTQIADLLSAGTDTTAIHHATQQLETELRTLRDQRAQVLRWAAARTNRNQLIDRTHRLAASANRALRHPTPELRQRIIQLLEITVNVTGHQLCPTCEGRGIIASGTPPRTQPRGHTGTICPTCQRYRTLPIIEIRGLLPDIDHLPQTPQPLTTGTPFTLRSTG